MCDRCWDAEYLNTDAGRTAQARREEEEARVAQQDALVRTIGSTENADELSDALLQCDPEVVKLKDAAWTRLVKMRGWSATHDIVNVEFTGGRRPRAEERGRTPVWHARGEYVDREGIAWTALTGFFDDAPMSTQTYATRAGERVAFVTKHRRLGGGPRGDFRTEKYISVANGAPVTTRGPVELATVQALLRSIAHESQVSAQTAAIENSDTFGTLRQDLAGRSLTDEAARVAWRRIASGAPAPVELVVMTGGRSLNPLGRSGDRRWRESERQAAWPAGEVWISDSALRFIRASNVLYMDKSFVIVPKGDSVKVQRIRFRGHDAQGASEQVVEPAGDATAADIADALSGDVR